MGVIIFISGPSGVGKSTACKKLAEDNSFVLIQQDSYFVSKEKKPLVRLSDGTELRNWDTYQSVDFDRFNADILKARFTSQVVIVEGFCLTASKIKVIPDLHIHISYVESEHVTYIEVGNESVIQQRMLESRKRSKPNVKNDELMIKEIVYPFYVQTLYLAKFDYVVPAFIAGERIPVDLVVNRLFELITRKM